MAERVADGNLALALSGNTIPTGAILVVLITVFGQFRAHKSTPRLRFAFGCTRRGKGKRRYFIYAARLLAEFWVYLLRI